MDQPIVARDMMVRNLVTLSPEMDVASAIDVLLRHRISGAPVVDGPGYFLGIFSERSSLEFVLHTAYEALPNANLMQFVDRDPPTIREETDLLTIAQTFLDASCRRLPVLDRNRRLLGQISRRDLLRAVRAQMRQRPSVDQGGSLYLSAIFAVEERPL
jgi:CBS domain-containing protein